MAHAIGVIITNLPAAGPVVVEVPADYRVYQLIIDLLQAYELEFLARNGEVVHYQLRFLDPARSALLPQLTFAQAKVLRASRLMLHRVGATQELVYTGPANGDYETLPINENASLEEQLDEEDAARVAPSGDYRQQVALFRAAGAYERAALALLERWQEVRGRLRLTPALLGRAGASDPEAEALARQLWEITARIVEAQLQVTHFEDFYAVLQAPQMSAFSQAYPQWKAELLDHLARGSYWLGQQTRYQDARDLAMLAVHFDEKFEAAHTLENLANQYATFHASDDPEERLELARSIYQSDPGYGKIADDLREALKANRHRLKPTARPIVPVGVAE